MADHFVDPTGELVIEAIAASGSLLTPANGRAANRCVSPTAHAAFWLRIRIPDINSSQDWVVSLQESRISHAVLYLPVASGWRSLEWSPTADHAANRPLLRYPAFRLDGWEIAGRVVYLRVETHSSMRALLWLESHRAYTVTYSQQSLAFGALIGAQFALFIYLCAIGWALKDGALLRLSALVLILQAGIDVGVGCACASGIHGHAAGAVVAM